MNKQPDLPEPNKANAGVHRPVQRPMFEKDVKRQGPTSSAPKSKDEKEKLFGHSLTPVNVLQRIQSDIVAFLGISEGINGTFTAVEQTCISTFEKVIRKGHCPSILVLEKPLTLLPIPDSLKT